FAHRRDVFADEHRAVPIGLEMPAREPRGLQMQLLGLAVATERAEHVETVCVVCREPVRQARTAHAPGRPTRAWGLDRTNQGHIGDGAEGGVRAESEPPAAAL